MSEALLCTMYSYKACTEGIRSGQFEMFFHLYRATSLIRNCRPLGPYSRPMRRDLRWS